MTVPARNYRARGGSMITIALAVILRPFRAASLRLHQTLPAVESVPIAVRLAVVSTKSNMTAIG